MTTASLSSQAFSQQFAQALADPASCAEHLFQLTPTSQQYRLFDTITYDLMKPLQEQLKRAAVRSGKGTGKTASIVVLAFWFALTMNPRWVVVIAPTMRQAKNIITEAQRLVDDGHPILREICDFTTEKITFFKKSTWKIQCVAAAHETNIQGMHDKGLVILMDEASGVSDAINEACESTLTNERSYLIKTGNPNFASGHFHGCFVGPNAHLYHKLQFNSEESEIVDQSNVRRLEAQYGRDSDEFRVSVLGEFPLSDAKVIITRKMLEEQPYLDAHYLVQEEHRRSFWRHRFACGIDIANQGSDESAFCFRSGGYAIPAGFEAFSKQEPMAVLQRAFQVQHNLGIPDDQIVYVFDATGLGNALTPVFHQQGKYCLPIVFNSAAVDRGFKNVITEAYFCLRHMLLERSACLPQDHMLWEELCSRQYKIDNDTIRLEKKEEHRKRLGRSPDRADAAVLAFYPHTAIDIQVAGFDPAAFRYEAQRIPELQKWRRDNPDVVEQLTAKRRDQQRLQRKRRLRG